MFRESGDGGRAERHRPGPKPAPASTKGILLPEHHTAPPLGMEPSNYSERREQHRNDISTHGVFLRTPHEKAAKVQGDLMSLRMGRRLSTGRIPCVYFGDLFKDGRYRVDRKLGDGPFSTVGLAIDERDSIVPLQIIRMTDT